jgi:hypothetical protein
LGAILLQVVAATGIGVFFAAPGDHTTVQLLKNGVPIGTAPTGNCRLCYIVVPAVHDPNEPGTFTIKLDDPSGGFGAASNMKARTSYGTYVEQRGDINGNGVAEFGDAIDVVWRASGRLP